MKIIHVIYHDWNKEQVRILASFGIKVETGMDRFDMEDGETFRQLEEHLDKWGAHKYAGTLYDKKDIVGSSLLVYLSVRENGYPQPEDVAGFTSLTYNTDDYCPDCGIGAVKKEPFRIKREPKWGTKKIFELTWVLDEVFVEKELYETYFKGLGLEPFTSKPAI